MVYFLFLYRCLYQLSIQNTGLPWTSLYSSSWLYKSFQSLIHLALPGTGIHHHRRMTGSVSIWLIIYMFWYHPTPPTQALHPARKHCIIPELMTGDCKITAHLWLIKSLDVSCFHDNCWVIRFICGQLQIGGSLCCRSSGHIIVTCTYVGHQWVLSHKEHIHSS